jgi:hypothetical protein
MPLAKVLLLALLALITLILVLPDVDLPDAAFQRNSSPSAIRSHSQVSPLLCAVHIRRLATSEATNLAGTESSFNTLIAESPKNLSYALRC